MTSAFGSSDPAARTPRGRWYLKLRPTSRDAVGQQRRGQRVAGMRHQLPPVELHVELARAVDPPAGREPPHRARLARQRRPRAPRGSACRAPPAARPGSPTRAARAPRSARPGCRGGSGSRGTPPRPRPPPAAPAASPSRDRLNSRRSRSPQSGQVSRIAAPRRREPSPLARCRRGRCTDHGRRSMRTLTVAACVAALLALVGLRRQRHRARRHRRARRRRRRHRGRRPDHRHRRRRPSAARPSAPRPAPRPTGAQCRFGCAPVPSSSSTCPVANRSIRSRAAAGCGAPVAIRCAKHQPDAGVALNPP